MNETYPVIEGASPWSAPGEGDRARVGAVVCHGFTGNPNATRPLGEAIAAEGYAVEVIRLPGHGTHWRDMAKTRYADWRAAVEASLDGLRARCDAVVLIGLSMGGTLVLDVTSARPDDVAGVVTINPPILDRKGILAKLAPLISKVIPVVPSKAAGLVKNDINREGVDACSYTNVPTKAANSLVQALPRVRAQIRGMTVPLLGAWSAQDESVPNENTLALPGLVGEGGDVRLLELPNSRHIATLDLDDALLASEIVAFIARVSGH